MQTENNVPVEKKKMDFKQEMEYSVRFIKSPCAQVGLGRSKLHHGSAQEAPQEISNQRLPLGDWKNSCFSCEG